MGNSGCDSWGFDDEVYELAFSPFPTVFMAVHLCSAIGNGYDDIRERICGYKIYVR